MPGGLWLNNTPSSGIINAMWVSLIKWHGDKLMCGPEERSLHIPTHSLRMPWPPGLVLLSQDLNINLPLSLFSRSAVVSGMQAWVPLHWLHRGGRGQGGGVKSLCVPAVASPRLIHIIISCRDSPGNHPETGSLRPPSPPDLFTHNTCVTFPCRHKPELASLPCTLHRLHSRLYITWEVQTGNGRMARMCGLNISSLSTSWGESAQCTRSIIQHACYLASRLPF